MTLKIGLLFPRSSLYPSIGFDVIEGFRAGLRQAGGQDLQLVTESVGIGGVGDDVYAKAERLLMVEQADILVAYLDHFAAEKIEPLVAAANRILIVIDPGASIPLSWVASPLRFHLTLDAAFGSRLTGGIAAASGCRHGLFATSFYDGGYGNCSAMTNDYTQRGGAVCYNFVAPFRFEDFDISPLRGAVESMQPDAVLGQLCRDSGALFLKEYAAAGLGASARFFASPFLLEETFLASLPFPFEGISGCVPWSKTLENETNRAFLRALVEESGREPNCFAALAWDAATFTSLVAEALRENNGNARKSADALQGSRFEGTRGPMALDDRTNYFTAPLYHATMQPAGDGTSIVALGEPVADLDQEWRDFTAQGMTGVFSRWTNTYLCTT